MAKEKISTQEQEEARDPFSANLRRSVIHAFEIAKATRGIKLKQDAIEQAIEAWVAAGPSSVLPVPNSRHTTLQPVPEVRKESVIGTEGTIQWVKQLEETLSSLERLNDEQRRIIGDAVARAKSYSQAIEDTDRVAQEGSEIARGAAEELRRDRGNTGGDSKRA